jgi:hypothetical protein
MAGCVVVVSAGNGKADDSRGTYGSLRVHAELMLGLGYR